MGRLIVVSNRIPVGDELSGGLVVALHECLQELGGIWLGANPELVEDPQPAVRLLGADGYTKMGFDLSEEDQENYYFGYANSVLWPLCHRRSDLMDLQPDYLDGYLRVNERVAEGIASLIEPDDLIWIHDYHFFPLAKALRARGVTARIGFFLHIPFPTIQDVDALPDKDQFVEWLSAYDLIGLQTEADVATCFEVFRRIESTEIFSHGRVGYQGKIVSIASFPIGIDPESFVHTAKQHDGRAAVNLLPGDQFVLGIDRLDYSKGLPQRMEGFGEWLNRRGEGDPRASFVQIATPSREAVEAYQNLRDELAMLAGKQNGRHSALDWTPIRYINSYVDRDTLAGLYRAADVCLVTPLADGMNLVAKEFVAAQDPSDPGVLVLSRFAGAAEQLTEALIVNPYDIASIADAIDQGLKMPREERVERYEAMAEVVFGQTVDAWARDFIKRLEGFQAVGNIANISLVS